MYRWTTREELVLQVVTRAREGQTRRSIARALNISRNTARKILVEHARTQQLPHLAITPKPARVPRARPLDAHRATIAKLLEEYPNVTAQRIFEELREKGFSGGYTAVKRYVRGVRPAAKPEPSLPTPFYDAGEMAESDWATRTIQFGNGDRRKLQFFGYILTHSTRKSFSVHERSDLHTLMAAHVLTFERFDGLAKTCKYDCQKAVVLGWEGPQPLYNPRFLAFATHYGYRPLACRPGHPNDKPRVERTFDELDESFFNARSFQDLDDLRAQLARWLETICDPRPHRKLKEGRLALFAKEHAHLLRQPTHAYDTARVAHRLCGIDGFVAWDGNRYAVPYDRITDILPIRITERELFIYAPDLALVARHELVPKGQSKDVGGDQYHPRRSRQSAMDLDQVERTFAALGGAAASFFAELAASLPRHAGYHGRQILLLRERYSTDDLLNALEHAQRFAAFEHKAIERILARRARPRTLAEHVEARVARRLRDQPGHEATGPRDLEDYDRLPPTTIREEKSCPDENHPPVRTTSSSDSDVTSRF